MFYRTENIDAGKAVSEALPEVFLARQGETDGVLSGQLTGRTDLPLTVRGEGRARDLGEKLRRYNFAKVSTSAAHTAELAGFGSLPEIDPDLAEWDYAQHEGCRTVDIPAQHPDRQLFRDGCPGGESVVQVGARPDRVVGRLRGVNANSLIFSSPHILRALAARWPGLEPARYFLLSTASLSVWDMSIVAASRLWNDIQVLLCLQDKKRVGRR